MRGVTNESCFGSVLYIQANETSDILQLTFRTLTQKFYLSAITKYISLNSYKSSFSLYMVV